MFAIIATGRGGNDDPKDTLRRVQLERDTLAEFVRVGLAQVKGAVPDWAWLRSRSARPSGMPILVELNDKLLSDWRTKHAGLPFRSLRKQAASVETEASPPGLGRFRPRPREIEALDDMMAEPAYDMRGWNQQMQDVIMDCR